jgi:hypothetical protein
MRHPNVSDMLTVLLTLQVEIDSMDTEASFGEPSS